MSQPIITIIGHVCIDKNTINNTRVETWGSPAMYMADYYLKNFGVKAHIVAGYGHDFSKYTGKFLFTETPDSRETMVYENIVNNGKRIQFCHNSGAALPVPPRKDIASLIQKSDILVFAPQIPNYSKEYIANIMTFAPKKCIKVLLPQGYMRQVSQNGKIEQRNFAEAGHILPYFDSVIASDEDYEGILSLASHWSGYRKGSSIIITQAEKGATVFCGIESKHIPTQPIAFSDIKNPVGSGDVFSAQVAISLYNKLNPYDAARKANQATAKSLLSDPSV